MKKGRLNAIKILKKVIWLSQKFPRAPIIVDLNFCIMQRPTPWPLDVVNLAGFPLYGLNTLNGIIDMM